MASFMLYLPKHRERLFVQGNFYFRYHSFSLASFRSNYRDHVLYIYLWTLPLLSSISRSLLTTVFQLPTAHNCIILLHLSLKTPSVRYNILDAQKNDQQVYMNTGNGGHSHPHTTYRESHTGCSSQYPDVPQGYRPECRARRDLP